MFIQYKVLRDNAKLPERGSDYAAGYDLFAAIDGPVTIAPHETKMIGTGLAMTVPHGYFGAIFARSGLASKQGLRPANCVGVCDSDYTGEWIVALHNDSEVERTVEPGQKVAQMVVLPCQDLTFIRKKDLETTDRGDGGFGSTGK